LNANQIAALSLNEKDLSCEMTFGYATKDAALKQT